MIDHRFSRDSFESLPHHDRRLRAAELAEEILALVATIPSSDAALSAVLGRLRLVGHHLYPLGEGIFAGDDSADAASPTGLSVRFASDTIEVSYRAPLL